MSKNKLKKQSNEVSISVDPKIYPLDAIYGASYNFIDKAYIFLDGDPNKKINIKLKSKPNTLTKLKDIQGLKKAFLNELLNTTWRYQISQENKNFREFILGTALLGSLGQLNPSEKFFTDTKSVREELEEEEMNNKELTEEKETFEDSLGIAVPWEEKFKSSNKSKAKKK